MARLILAIWTLLGICTSVQSTDDLPVNMENNAEVSSAISLAYKRVLLHMGYFSILVSLSARMNAQNSDYMKKHGPKSEHLLNKITEILNMKRSLFLGIGNLVSQIRSVDRIPAHLSQHITLDFDNHAEANRIFGELIGEYEQIFSFWVGCSIKPGLFASAFNKMILPTGITPKEHIIYDYVICWFTAVSDIAKALKIKFTNVSDADVFSKRIFVKGLLNMKQDIDSYNNFYEERGSAILAGHVFTSFRDVIRQIIEDIKFHTDDNITEAVQTMFNNFERHTEVIERFKL